MFVDKDGAYPRGAQLGEATALLKSIRLACNGLPGTNVLAYYPCAQCKKEYRRNLQLFLIIKSACP